MPTDFFRRRPVWALAATAALGVCFDSLAASPHEGQLFSIIGSAAWGPAPVSLPIEPRVNVLETDAWRQSFRDGSLTPVPRQPLPQSPWSFFWQQLWRKPASTGLLPKSHFTPAVYLEQTQELRNTHSFQRDVLMYYGGIRYQPSPEGLNFNGWSGADLTQLRQLGARPFIGLETFDRAAVKSMAWRLKEAGYGPLQRIYIRIASEPAFSFYGTEDGTRTGKKNTPAAHVAYKRRFTQTAELINQLNRQLGLNMHNVFAGTHRADFANYMPPTYTFDALGYDLYITPENKREVLALIKELSKKYPHKPMVIPEFGVATERHSSGWFGPRTRWADPKWAADTLGDVLMALGKHPAGIDEITVFSINVSGRRRDRRWNWAWTPQMYEMLKEWQTSPRTWKKQGFHRYDPNSYPVGRDVLVVNHRDLKIVYRKLAAEQAPGVPLFQEISLYRQNRTWHKQSKLIYFQGLEKRPYHSNRPVL